MSGLRYAYNTNGLTSHRLDDAVRRERGWLLAATAHPYKFADIVEPLIGRPVEPSPPLARIADLPVRKEPIAADPEALASAIGDAR